MSDILVVIVTIVQALFIAWVCYDMGYDKGWADRDEGKPY